MTDKTIIDSMDVSGCELYNKNLINSCIYCRKCENTPCFYKLNKTKEISEQLKRKEDECKDWKQKAENEHQWYQNTLKLAQSNLDRYIEAKRQLQAEKQKVKELEEKHKAYEEIQEWFKTANLPKTEKGLKQRLFEAETKVKELKQYKHAADNLGGKQIIITNKDKMPYLYENFKDKN